jgi:hypothetical protein
LAASTRSASVLPIFELVLDQRKNNWHIERDDINVDKKNFLGGLFKLIFLFFNKIHSEKNESYFTPLLDQTNNTTSNILITINNLFFTEKKK